MNQRLFVMGNEAVAWGAVSAGCLHFFGYPITPQNQIPEWFARELPKRGGDFVQAQDETGAINMLFGAAAAGVRVLASTSGPGWSLMQEGMSNAVAAELPFVIVEVQRPGPGIGVGTRFYPQSQVDYKTITKGGGHGGYNNIVLAPVSVQEACDLTQLAFYLADKYRNPVILLMDHLVGEMREPLEVRPLEFGPLPEKDWAVLGKTHHKDGKKRLATALRAIFDPPPLDNRLAWTRHFYDKYQTIAASEVRYESYKLEDAELIVVAFGCMARLSKQAAKAARSKGLRVGLVRPTTLWPFPQGVLKDNAKRGAKFLVVEANMGQMVDDVRLSVEGQADIRLLAEQNMSPTGDEWIMPERILQEIEDYYMEGKVK